MCFRNSSTMFDTIRIIPFSHCSCCSNDQKKQYTHTKTLVQRFVWLHILSDLDKYHVAHCTCNVPCLVFIHQTFSNSKCLHYVDDPLSLSLCSDKQKHQTLNIACIQQYNTLAYLHYTCYKFIDWLGVSSGSSGALWIYSLLCCCTRIRPTKCLTNDLVGQSELKKSHAKYTNTHAKHLPIKTASKISQEICSRQRIKAVCNSYNLYRQNNRWIEDWIRIDDVERIQIQGLFVQHHRIYWMTKGTDGKIILKMQHL